MNIEYKRIKSVFILLVLCLLTVGCPPYKGTYDHRDTNGLARGVAVTGFYAFVADGTRGLKIFNISNPLGVTQEGALDLPGFNVRVTVGGPGDIAILTDTDLNKIYIIDTSDKFNPQLVWTFDTLDKPIAFYFRLGIVYIVERGDDPQAGSYFSGVEAVSCRLSDSPVRLSSTPVDNISDLICPGGAILPDLSGRLYAVSKDRLYVFDILSKGGIDGAPVSSYNFGGNESIQSIAAISQSDLLVLGKNLYVMDTSNPSAPVVVDSEIVPGYEHNRVITTSGVVMWGYLPPGATGWPYWRIEYICFCYSTLREFGWGRINTDTKEISFVKEEIDIHGESEGLAKLYDIKLIHSGRILRGPYERGEKTIAVVGALDNYGLAFEILESITWEEFNSL